MGTLGCTPPDLLDYDLGAVTVDDAGRHWWGYNVLQTSSISSLMLQYSQLTYVYGGREYGIMCYL